MNFKVEFINATVSDSPNGWVADLLAKGCCSSGSELEFIPSPIHTFMFEITTPIVFLSDFESRIREYHHRHHRCLMIVFRGGREVVTER